MKNKIIEILESNCNVSFEHGADPEAIDKDRFNMIADEIVKLFAIPAVSNLVCDCIGCTEVHQINGKFICGTCNRPLAQTCA